MNATTPAARVRISVNGAGRDFPRGATVADLVADLAPEARLVAVECNAEIVPKARWTTTILATDDKVELVRFVQGG